MRRYILNTVLFILFSVSTVHAQRPTITSFSPLTGPAGTLVTITGTGLASPLTLIIAGTPAVVVSTSATSIVAMVMPNAAQGVVQVYTAGGINISNDVFIRSNSSYPAFQQGNKLVGSGGSAFAFQGTAVALSADGNTAIVTGDRDNGSQGSAWIFTRSNGTWSQQGTRLQGTAAVGAALQGISAAISADGNTAVIGGFNDNGGVGAAWIFVRDNNGIWTQQGNKLVGTASVGPSNQGRSVSISADGNTVIVGGHSDDNNQGAVWVYTRSNGVWTQEGNKLVGTGAATPAAQGISVSLSANGNVALIGGYGDDNNTGASWVFTRSAGVWTQQGNKLLGSAAVIPSYQGNAVSLSADGKTAIIGGFFDNGNAGASWIFTEAGGVWTQQGNKLIGTGASGAAWQGSSVAISADGNTALVGGYSDAGSAGAAWIFRRAHGNWTQQGNKIRGSGGVGTQRQGWSNAMSADATTGLLGGDEDNSNLGAAWPFTIPSNNADLSSLTVSAGTLTPSFAGAITAYSTTVATTASAVTLTPAVSDATASVTVNGISVTSATSSGPISLTVGTNTITTTVTAQDGVTTRNYVITITRLASSNADLSSLSTSSGILLPVFTSNTVNYTVNVTNATTSIAFTPVTSDLTAVVEVNGITTISGTSSAYIPLSVGSNIITTQVFAQDGVTYKTYSVTVSRAGSSNAGLLALSTSAGLINPVFTTTTTGYSSTVPYTNSSVAITPTVSDPTATVTVNGITVTSGSASGSITLVTGTNTIPVKVFAQDGITTQTYLLSITRQPSNNADLSSLALSSGTLLPAFSSSVLAYSITVGNTVSSINLTPAVSDIASTVTVNGITVTSGSVSSNINLAVGNNIITTLVTAQDGVTIKTYIVHVTRAASPNADLASLGLSNASLSPAFTSAITVYAATVNYAITSTIVLPVVSDNTAMVAVNGVNVASGGASAPISLSLGNNTVIALVTAQDGTTQAYSIVITRLLPSSNADLSSLIVSVGILSPGFLGSVTAYSLTVPFSSGVVNLTPTLSDINANMQVNAVPTANGSSSAIQLQVGNNIVQIVVTAQDGTTKSYTVTIVRSAPSSNADLSSLAISAGNLSPTFTSSVTAYAANVAYTTSATDLTPILADASASLQINGTQALNGTARQVLVQVGVNTYQLVVTAQDGVTTKSYSVAITRAAPPADADLSSLVISAGAISPAFSTAATAYTASISYSTGSITINPGPHDPRATVEVNGTNVVNGGSIVVPLQVGNNTILINVIAQDGTTLKTYSLTIHAQIEPIAGNATPLCPGASTTLADATPGGVWSSDNTAIATVSATGTTTAISPGTATLRYKVSGSTPAQTDEASFIVTVRTHNSIGITASDSTLCNGSSVLLTVSNGTSYQWFKNNSAINGSTASQIVITNPGTYYAVGTDNQGCQSTSASIVIPPLPVIKADFVKGNDHCVDMPVVLTNTSNVLDPSLVGFNWSDNNVHSSIVPSPSFVYTQPGNYSVQLRVNSLQCAAAKDSIAYVVAIDKPVPGILLQQVDVARNNSVMLQARTFPNAQYNWQPANFLSATNLSTPFINAAADQTYSITITMSSGCITVDSLRVRAFDLNTFYLPNAFSPNGNGVNDIFKPLPVGIASLRSFRIYNKWGKLIFESNSLSTGWNGRYGGVMQPVDTYVWVVEGVDIQGNYINKKGTVTLVR